MKKKNERGYTFLESIFQLLIMTLFVHLIILFFVWKGPIEHRYSDYTTIQWELFSAELQQLLADVSEVQILQRLNGTKVIHLQNEHGKIDIEKISNVIRKRVNGEGHITLCTDIHSFEFTLDGMSLTVFATMANGTTKERRFAIGLYSK